MQPIGMKSERFDYMVLALRNVCLVFDDEKLSELLFGCG